MHLLRPQISQARACPAPYADSSVLQRVHPIPHCCMMSVADHVPYGLDTNEKPYRCPCGSSFSRRDLLQRHERLAHHSGRPEIVPSSTLTTTVSGSVAIAATPLTTAELETHHQESVESRPISLSTRSRTSPSLLSANNVARKAIPFLDLRPSRKRHMVPSPR
jgi:hypothetical protein